MVGAVLAVIAGVVALLGLTGRLTVPRVWMRTVMAGLPIVAVSGAHFAPGGWSLPVAIGMTLSVVLGMLASMIGPAELEPPSGNWVAQAWRLTSVLLVGIVLGSVVIRWGASIMAPIPLLSPRDVALVLAVAAVAAAAGGRSLRGLISTATVILLVLFALVVVVGVVAGKPTTLTAPLLPVEHPAGAYLLFLIGFVLAASSPALRRIRAEGGSIVPGTIVTGVIMLVGLVALLAFSGGYVKLPSFGLATVAGYLGFRSPIPGAVLCGLIAVVILAAAVLSYRAVFTTHDAFRGSSDGTAPTGWWHSRWFVALVVGLVAVVLAVNVVPLEPILWAAALFVLSGWVVAWWAARNPEEEGAGVDPVPVGQGTSDSADR